MTEEISSLARCVLQQMSNCVYTMQLSSPWVAIRSHCRCCFLSVGRHELKDKASSHGRHVWGGRRQVDAEGTVAHGLAHFQSAVPVVTRKVLPSKGMVVRFALSCPAHSLQTREGAYPRATGIQHRCGKLDSLAFWSFPFCLGCCGRCCLL